MIYPDAAGDDADGDHGILRVGGKRLCHNKVRDMKLADGGHVERTTPCIARIDNEMQMVFPPGAQQCLSGGVRELFYPEVSFDDPQHDIRVT
ncbi:MAG: hypothetical protein WCR20_17200 [Verrucomicrobiota bacterium]